MTEPQVWAAISLLATIMVGFFVFGFGSLNRTINTMGQKLDHQIGALRTEMNLRFERVDDKFEIVNIKFARVDEKFDRVDEKFSQIDARIEGMESNIAKIGAKIEGLDRDVQALTKRVFRDEDL